MAAGGVKAQAPSGRRALESGVAIAVRRESVVPLAAAAPPPCEGAPGTRTCPFSDPTAVPPVFLAPHRVRTAVSHAPWDTARGISVHGASRLLSATTPGPGPDGPDLRRAPSGVQRVDGCGGSVRNARGSLCVRNALAGLRAGSDASAVARTGVDGGTWCAAAGFTL